MFGRTVILLAAGMLLILMIMPAALADQIIPVNQQYTMNGKSIIVTISEIDIAPDQMNNIHYDVDPSNVVWARIYYSFENTGDTTDQAFLAPVLYDSNGNGYAYDPNHQMPTTTWIKPHFKGSTMSPPAEIPVPKNATLTQLICHDGTIDHSITLSQPSPSPSPVTGTPTPSPTPAGKSGWHDCIPLIPFAMAGGIAAAGMVINRSGIIKK